MCSVLLLVSAAFTFALTSASVRVEVSPVVHVAAPFSAVLQLPASAALNRKGVDAQAYLVDDKGQEIQLNKKRKLSTVANGEVVLEHELEGLLIGCVCLLSAVSNVSNRI